MYVVHIFLPRVNFHPGYGQNVSMTLLNIILTLQNGDVQTFQFSINFLPSLSEFELS